MSFVISAPRKISRCDMDWIETKGREPQKREQPYWLLFRNGKESKQPYTATVLCSTYRSCDRFITGCGDVDRRLPWKPDHEEIYVLVIPHSSLAGVTVVPSSTARPCRAWQRMAGSTQMRSLLRSCAGCSRSCLQAQ